MLAAVDRRPAPTPLARAAGVLSLPAAPVWGAAMAYLMYHPPRRRHHRDPADFDLPARETWVRLPRTHHRLHAWFIPGRSTDRVVLLSHPMGLTKSASLAHAAFLHRAGYTVCLFDHRNHGTSGRDPAPGNLGRRFTDDVESVIDHVRAMPEHADARFVVYGFSFSAFPHLYVLLRPAAAHVGAVVCDSGPAHGIRELFRNFFAADAIKLPLPLRAPPARSAAAWTCGWLGTELLQSVWPPPAEGAYLHTPMLFLSGEHDVIVPPQQLRDLSEPYPRAEVRVLPRARHLELLKTDPAAYEAVVLEFLARSLGG